MKNYSLLHAVLLLAVTATLAGCAGKNQTDTDWAKAAPIIVPPPVPTEAGAIWRTNNSMGLFSDNKARNPGDILTIVLSESTQAKTSASTKLKKDNSTSIDVPLIAGRPVHVKGTDVLANELAASREFSGSGDSAQSNQLTGDITVTIIEKLGNGNLLVRGEKKLRLNQGNETVRVEGIVRPADIAPDNTILSSRVADARISYSGRGSLGDANKPGWLSRLFNSGWMPF